MCVMHILSWQLRKECPNIHFATKKKYYLSALKMIAYCLWQVSVSSGNLTTQHVFSKPSNILLNNSYTMAFHLQYLNTVLYLGSYRKKYTNIRNIIYFYIIVVNRVFVTSLWRTMGDSCHWSSISRNNPQSCHSSDMSNFSCLACFTHCCHMEPNHLGENAWKGTALLWHEDF